MNFDLPTYEFLIDENDESGVSTISLVTMPAMKSSFIAFDADLKKHKYIFIQKDGYKGIVAGLAMIPMQLIYRKGDDGQEYNGYFTAETIEKIRNKYHKTVMNLKSVNLEHSETFINAYLIESYLLDTPAMVEAVKAKGIDEACLGAWYTAFKIENPQVFQACLEGVFTGFSVEAFLDRELKMSINNFNKINSKKMKKNLVERLKERVNKILEEVNFEDALVPDLNLTATWGAVGEKVTKTYTNSSNQEVTEPIGVGEFVVEDGRTLITDVNSGLLEVRPAVAEPVAPVVGDTVEMVDPPVDEPPVIPPVIDKNQPAASGVTTVENSNVEVIESAEDLACKKKLEDEALRICKSKLTDVPLEDIPLVAPPMLPPEPAPTIDVATKTIGELVDVTKDGDYYISVSVSGGKIVEAYVEVEQELVTQELSAIKQKFADAETEIAKLKARLAEPIATPILRENLTEVIAYQSNYEKIAKRNNLPVV